MLCTEAKCCSQLWGGRLCQMSWRGSTPVCWRMALLHQVQLSLRRANVAPDVLVLPTPTILQLQS